MEYFPTNQIKILRSNYNSSAISTYYDKSDFCQVELRVVLSYQLATLHKTSSGRQLM